MKIVNTYYANIYVGFREGYSEKVHSIARVEKICEKIADECGMCVTVTPTKFIYTGGAEDGCIVGLINYPRFPSTPESITTRALGLAKILKRKLGQLRCSVVTPDTTYMLD